MIRTEYCLHKGQWLKDTVIEWNEQGIITALSVDVQNHPLPLQKGFLIPGFVDLQVNGGGGVLFNQTPTLAGIRRIFAAHMQFGTTAMLPTLITDQSDIMQQASDAIALAISEGEPGIVGIHFEGPNLSTIKKGVHKANFMHPPTDSELKLYTRQDIGKVLVTLAPEIVPTDIIRDLSGQGVKICLGHSNADVDSVQMALEAGATGFTHLFNAMSPMTSRQPGMVGAALADNASYCGLILDHLHVHPVTSKVAINAKGPDKIMLVTDAMAHVGFAAQTIPFYDTHIQRNGNKLTTPDGTLAGSCLDMLSAVKHAHFDLGVDLTDAIHMASQTPANYLNAKDIGALVPKKRADMLLVDKKLTLLESYVGGIRQVLRQAEG